MRLLFVGDVVGRSGRTAVTERLPALKRDWKLDCVIVNGENAAGGFGITEPIYHELIDAGADVISGGNHSWDQREALVFIERAPRLIRPHNYPPGTPGRGTIMVDDGEGIVERIHEDAAHRVHHQHARAVLGLDHRRALARRAFGKIDRADELRRALDEDQSLALIPGVIAERHRVGAGADQLF